MFGLEKCPPMEYVQIVFTTSRKKNVEELFPVVKTMILAVLRQKNYGCTQKKKKLEPGKITVLSQKKT
tara:strand:- start:1784 stop:1987 length:204 start_codon:yes stop_codon:yes gene_type:complete